MLHAAAAPRRAEGGAPHEEAVPYRGTPRLLHNVTNMLL